MFGCGGSRNRSRDNNAGTSTGARSPAQTPRVAAAYYEYYSDGYRKQQHQPVDEREVFDALPATPLAD